MDDKEKNNIKEINDENIRVGGCELSFNCKGLENQAFDIIRDYYDQFGNKPSIIVFSWYYMEALKTYYFNNGKFEKARLKTFQGINVIITKKDEIFEVY